MTDPTQRAAEEAIARELLRQFDGVKPVLELWIEDQDDDGPRTCWAWIPDDVNCTALAKSVVDAIRGDQ